LRMKGGFDPQTCTRNFILEAPDYGLGFKTLRPIKLGTSLFQRGEAKKSKKL